MAEEQVDCLALFEPIQAQMALAKEENDRLVFNYDDPKDEKAARSHIQKLRHVKTEIATVHRAAKAEALAIGRKIDGFKNKLTGEVDEMIAVHKDPIDRIQRAREEAEAAELRKIQEAEAKKEADRLADLERREAAVKAAEEKAAAEKAQKLAKEERVRAEAERIEREKQIAQQAKLQAEQDAKRKLEEAERKRLADIEAVKAKAKAEAEAKEKAEREKQEWEARKERKRVENKKHQMKIHREINERLEELVSHAEDLNNLYEALVAGSIPHVTIQY
jgi:hypothetical protein